MYFWKTYNNNIEDLLSWDGMLQQENATDNVMTQAQQSRQKTVSISPKEMFCNSVVVLQVISTVLLEMF